MSERVHPLIDDRNYIGYGENLPHAQWPGDARIALNINLNFEGGGERSLMDGDGTSEGMLNHIGMPAYPGLRSPIVESVFEYGSRVGGWRLLRLFRKFDVKVCLLAVACAARRNPDLARAYVADGHEIVSHHYRWLDYQTMPEAEEREHIRMAFETLEQVCGVESVGWMTGRPARTRGARWRKRDGFSTSRLLDFSCPTGGVGRQAALGHRISFEPTTIAGEPRLLSGATSPIMIDASTRSTRKAPTGRADRLRCTRLIGRPGRMPAWSGFGTSQTIRCGSPLGDRRRTLEDRAPCPGMLIA
jgi:peptidoglycan/xylan/chitin deacetylase (PgdA/CDA1 family)